MKAVESTWQGVYLCLKGSAFAQQWPISLNVPESAWGGLMACFESPDFAWHFLILSVCPSEAKHQDMHILFSTISTQQSARKKGVYSPKRRVCGLPKICNIPPNFLSWVANNSQESFAGRASVGCAGTTSKNLVRITSENAPKKACSCMTPLITVSGSTPTPWSGPLPRPWSETMVSSPLWAQKTLEIKGFLGLGRPFLDLVSQTPRPRGRGRPLFADLRCVHTTQRVRESSDSCGANRATPASA